MKIGKSYLTKENLEKLTDEKNQLFIMQFAMAMTEINIFRKLVRSCDEQESQDGNEDLETGRLQIRYSLMFVLCGKIYEAWLLINSLRENGRVGNFDKLKNMLNPAAKLLFEELKEYFDDKRPSLIEDIRNRYGNHYDKKLMKKALEGKGFGGIWFFGLENDSHNFFSTATQVITLGLFDKIIPDDLEKSVPKLWDDVDRIAALISQFGFDFGLYATVKNYNNEFEVPDPRPEDNIFNNFFKNPIPIMRKPPIS